MDSHRKAHHIDCLDDIGRPVATFLVGLYLIDDHVVLLLAVGIDIERRKEHLAGVLHACEEVDNLLLLLNDAIHLLLAVGNTLGLEDTVPEAVGNLNVILDGRRVLQLCFLGHTDELLDVVPVALEERAIVGDWVVGAVGGRNAADDGELATLRRGLGGLHGRCGGLSETIVQITPGRMRVEHLDFLDLVLAGDSLPPVSIEEVGDTAVLLCRGETTVAGLLAENADDAGCVGTEDDDTDAEPEVLEVLTDAEEIGGKVVVHEVMVDVLPDVCFGFRCVIDQAGTIANLGIENLAGGKRLVAFYKLKDFVGHLVVRSPGHILVALVERHRKDIRLFAEDLRRTGCESGGGFQVRNVFNGVEGIVKVLWLVHILAFLMQRYEGGCI